MFKIVYVMPNGLWFFFSDLGYSTIEAAVAEKNRYDFKEELKVAAYHGRTEGWKIV